MIICINDLNAKKQANYPQFKYKNYETFELQTNKLLNPIISGTSILLEEETVVDEIILTNPSLPLHKSETKLMLGIGGIFIRKGIDTKIKQKFKEK